MKTAHPQENFLVSVKNGKIGPFRSNSTPTTIAELFNEKIPFDWIEEGWLLADNLEAFFFADGFLSQVRFKFNHPEQAYSWHKHLQLQWIPWLGRQNFNRVQVILKESGIEFRSLTYIDGSLGLLCHKYPATMHFIFSENGTPDCLLLTFVGHSLSLFSIRSMEAHNCRTTPNSS